MAKKPTKEKPKTTVKQQRFIDLYDGNLSESAKKAGISRSYAKKIVSNSTLLDLIKDRETERKREGIANREDRQVFWSGVLKGEIVSKTTITQEDGTEIEKIVQPKMADRLKASELLGRSEADFTDNLKVTEIKPMVVFDEDE